MNELKTTYEWQSLPWRKLERFVYKLQKRIYRASQRGDIQTVHKLQRLMVNSKAAKYLAVRRITQENQGKKTAGVDGVKSLSSKARLNLVERLKLGHSAKPVRRVWIPKPRKPKRDLWAFPPFTTEHYKHWSNWHSNPNRAIGHGECDSPPLALNRKLFLNPIVTGFVRAEAVTMLLSPYISPSLKNRNMF